MYSVPIERPVIREKPARKTTRSQQTTVSFLALEKAAANNRAAGTVGTDRTITISRPCASISDRLSSWQIGLPVELEMQLDSRLTGPKARKRSTRTARSKPALAQRTLDRDVARKTTRCAF